MFIFNRKTISVLLALCFALGVCACAFAAPADNEMPSGYSDDYVYTGSFVKQGDFASSLNMLRIVKNRYYNSLDGALGEDRSLSYLLYRFFDFVYGDSVLDLFTDCFAGDEQFTASLASMGCVDARIFHTGDKWVTACVDFFGTPRALKAYYDPDTDSAKLCVYENGVLVISMEWSATDEGYNIRYMRAISAEEFDALYGEPAVNEEDEDLGDSYVGQEPMPEPHLDIAADATPAPIGRTEQPADTADPYEQAVPSPELAVEPVNKVSVQKRVGSYIGYTAYLRDDGTGTVKQGPFYVVKLVDILDSTEFVANRKVTINMFNSETYTLTLRFLTVQGSAGSAVHELGVIPTAAPAEPYDEP